MAYADTVNSSQGQNLNPGLSNFRAEALTHRLPQQISVIIGSCMKYWEPQDRNQRKGRILSLGPCLLCFMHKMRPSKSSGHDLLLMWLIQKGLHVVLPPLGAGEA
jgi:hypothetical protein